MQWHPFPRIWIHGKHTCIQSSPGWHVCSTCRIGWRNTGALCRDCSYFETDPWKCGIHHHHPRTMETVLEGGKWGNVVIQIWTALWALNSREQIWYYLTLPCSASYSDTCPCSPTRTVVARTVSNVGEDPWCDTGGKAMRNLANGRQLQCNKQDCIRCANDEQHTGHHLIPKEIFSKKNQMADDGTLCKTLFYNITRQAWVPAAIALVDASNCYNRIARAMASLIFQAFGVPLMAVEMMLGAIENMKFFLQTGCGDLTLFTGGGISIKHRDSHRVMGHHQQVGQSLAYVSWKNTVKRSTGHNSTVQLPTCSITFWQLSTWTT